VSWSTLANRSMRQEIVRVPVVANWRLDARERHTNVLHREVRMAPIDSPKMSHGRASIDQLILSTRCDKLK
jgi:hypothetical protein